MTIVKKPMQLNPFILIIAIFFSVFTGCKKNDSKINNIELSGRWNYISTTGYAFSPNQNFKPIRLSYQPGSYLTIANDTIWQINRYKPNFFIQVDGLADTIMNFTGSMSPAFTSETTIYRRINDTTFVLSGYNIPDTYIRELSSTSLVVYYNNYAQAAVGIFQIDSLKR
ncbi:hypothetical protein [Ferruginibacter profundus]